MSPKGAWHRAEVAGLFLVVENRDFARRDGRAHHLDPELPGLGHRALQRREGEGEGLINAGITDTDNRQMLQPFRHW